MKNFKIIYGPTGRLVGTVSANTETGAKRKATKEFGYMNWNLYFVIEE